MTNKLALSIINSMTDVSKQDKYLITYFITIYFHGSENEEFTIEAESSRKAVVTLFEIESELEEKKISVIKVDRMT